MRRDLQGIRIERTSDGFLALSFVARKSGKRMKVSVQAMDHQMTISIRDGARGVIRDRDVQERLENFFRGRGTGTSMMGMLHADPEDFITGIRGVYSERKVAANPLWVSVEGVSFTVRGVPVLAPSVTTVAVIPGLRKYGKTLSGSPELADVVVGVKTIVNVEVPLE